MTDEQKREDRLSDKEYGTYLNICNMRDSMKATLIEIDLWITRYEKDNFPGGQNGEHH